MKSHWYYCPIFSECCHQEIDKVLHDNELVTYEVRSQMPYMQVCMKEKKTFCSIVASKPFSFWQKGVGNNNNVENIIFVIQLMNYWVVNFDLSFVV